MKAGISVVGALISHELFLVNVLYQLSKIILITLTDTKFRFYFMLHSINVFATCTVLELNSSIQKFKDVNHIRKSN